MILQAIDTGPLVGAQRPGTFQVPLYKVGHDFFRAKLNVGHCRQCVRRLGAGDRRDAEAEQERQDKMGGTDVRFHRWT